MNRKMVLYMVGQILLIESVAMLLPVTIGIIYREWQEMSIFLGVALVAALIGGGLMFLCRHRNPMIFAKEGFVITALSWVALSLVGALPFTLSGEIPNYIDAVFETVSGFTTTGSSILAAPQDLTHTAMFWRSFTHWMGGMGVIVLVMAVMPTVTGRSMHILRAEVPGPVVDKLVPKVRDTAKILYLIYIALTVVEIIVLWAFGMPLFESVIHSIGTAGTGGFGIKPDSIGSYSATLQWIITIFMVIFGVNFNVYYLVLRRKLGAAIKSTELWAYLGIAVIATAVICFSIFPIYNNFSDTIRHSAFQVATVMSTTGYVTTDFNAWPYLAKSVILLLMFIGGCAGSTAGGLKVSRVVLLYKTAKRELARLLHPRSVKTVQVDGKTVNDETLRGVGAYFIIYMLSFAVIFLLLSFEPFSLETNLSATATCFNNVGPGLGGVGPASNFSAYSPIAKMLLSFAMLLGRLEIYPMLLLVMPSTWTKK